MEQMRFKVRLSLHCSLSWVPTGSAGAQTLLTVSLTKHIKNELFVSPVPLLVDVCKCWDVEILMGALTKGNIYESIRPALKRCLWLTRVYSLLCLEL